jgi:membrane dipeptidase
MYLRKAIVLQSMFVLPVLLHGSGSPSAAAETDAQLRERANRLAHEILLLDTHLDTPYEVLKKEYDISVRADNGHFDYVRARQGGLDALFMAVYVPPEYEEKGGAKALADETIDLVEGFGRKWPDKFVGVSSIEEIRRQHGSGRISLLLGLENGSALEGDWANLKHFYDRGIRYITLTHSKNNHICDSSFDEGPKWHGLSPFGKQLIAEMNRLGMMIDVSHASDEAFYQILELSKAPVVATHSACRHFTPGWQRNMSDEMIRLLARKGGVIQVNFGSMFVSTAVNREAESLRREVRRYVQANHLQGRDRDRYIEQRWRQTQFSKATISDVVANIDHIVKLVGIEHVGLGSDFDGVSDVPEGLADVSCYPNLLGELLERGYREPEIRRLCGENFLQVWAAVQKAATACQPEK